MKEYVIINEESEKDIVKLYENGLSMGKIGKQYDVSSARILRILDKYKVKKRTKGGIYQLDESRIIDEYKSGKSSTEISAENNVTIKTITNILEKNGIKRDNIYHNLDLIENYWETIDTYDKAYFLGFLIADGNVFGNMVRLQLSEKDEHILNIFSEKTKNSNKISVDKRRFVGFNVKRKKWVEDLSKYGVVPNKTFTSYLPILSDDMMPHLLRGLIDGDGWVSYKSKSIGFCGNEIIVTQVRDFFVEKLSVYNVKVIHSDTNLYMINWSSQKDIKKIGEYIYANKNDCYLERKFKNYENIIHANIEVISEIAKGSETP